jgi:hypothetical protein
MAKNPIGKPIPVGDLSSLAADEMPSTASTENPPFVTESSPSEPSIAGTIPALAESVQPAPMASGAVPMRGWADFTEMSWRLAWLPAVTWSSYMEATWKAWERAAQPQWPTR